MSLPNHILTIDFETTGLVPAYDHPTQIAIVEFEDGEPTGQAFYRKIRPSDKAKISIEALAVQGIDPRDAWANLFSDDALYPKDAMSQIAEWTISNGLNTLPVVAQKASFDWGFMCEKLEINRSAHKGNALSPVWICTKSLASHVWPDGKPKSLNALLTALGLEGRQHKAHEALEDAIKCGEVYFGLKKLLEEQHGN